jgi:MFS family permease
MPKEVPVKQAGSLSFISGFLILITIAHFAHHFLLTLLTPLLPYLQKDLMLDNTQIGILNSAFSIPYGLSHIPFGWLTDRVDSRLLILIGISGAAAAGLLVGLSPTYILIVAALILLGTVSGSYHPVSAPLVSASVDVKQRGRALGLHQIGGTASHFLTPIIAAGIATYFGWRGSFIILSIPTILFGILLYFVLGRMNYAGKDNYQHHGEAKKDDASFTFSWGRIISFLILSVVGYTIITGIIAFVVYSAGFWAGPLGGYLSDRFGRVRVTLGASLLAGPIIYLLSRVSMGIGVYLVLIGIGMSLYLRMPVSEAFIISNTTQRNRGTILGVYYFGTRGGTGLVAPVIGYLIDSYGYSTTFLVCGAAMVVLTLVSAIFLWGRQD